MAVNINKYLANVVVIVYNFLKKRIFL